MDSPGVTVGNQWIAPFEQMGLDAQMTSSSATFFLRFFI